MLQFKRYSEEKKEELKKRILSYKDGVLSDYFLSNMNTYLDKNSKRYFKFFHEQRDLDNYMRFFGIEKIETKYLQGSIWNQSLKQIRKLIVMLASQNYKNFVFEKAVRNIILYPCLFDALEKKDKRDFFLVYEKKELVNIVEVESNFKNAHTKMITPKMNFWIDTKFANELIFSKEHMSSILKKEPCQYYLKDIMANLFSLIKHTDMTYKKLIEPKTLSQFFDTKKASLQESSKEYLGIAKEIIESQTFYRKRQDLPYTRLNKKTFVNFFSQFAKEHLTKRDGTIFAKSFYEEMKSKKLRNNDFRPNFIDGVNFTKQLLNYSDYARCALHERIGHTHDGDEQRPVYANDFTLHYRDTKTYLENFENYINEVNTDLKVTTQCKKINPKRYESDY